MIKSKKKYMLWVLILCWCQNFHDITDMERNKKEQKFKVIVCIDGGGSMAEVEDWKVEDNEKKDIMLVDYSKICALFWSDGRKLTFPNLCMVHKFV